jgi:hypothetical protein
VPDLARAADELHRQEFACLPDAAELVTVKGSRKCINVCANPADAVPAGSAALCRLRDRVVAVGAEPGFYISVRGFTAEAQHYAETAPLQLD